MLNPLNLSNKFGLANLSRTGDKVRLNPGPIHGATYGANHGAAQTGSIVRGLATKRQRWLSRGAILACLALAGCGQDGATAPETSATTGPAAAAKAFEQDLRLKLENAKPGDVIEIAAGTHPMTRSLVLNTNQVTIRGAGMDASILSFKGQLAGAEGLLVNASDFTIEDVAIEDAKGDALKINEGRNIVVRRVRTEWTGGPATENGAYGIYPVQTENVLVEGSVAIAASDAGIYVGQSKNIIVRNNRAEYNVAGIEIENSVGADVYDNVADNNTGGILVFNMPDIPMSGHSTRVYNNKIRNNNTANYGVPGSAVSGVPAGSGVVINANDKVEIFNNQLENNDTANILISSYYSANFAGQRELAEGFDPYPEQIFVYANEYVGGGSKPDQDALKGWLSTQGDGARLPNILWDGFVRADSSVADMQICVADEASGLLNIDAGNAGAKVTSKMDAHRCSLPKLEEISL